MATMKLSNKTVTVRANDKLSELSKKLKRVTDEGESLDRLFKVRHIEKMRHVNTQLKCMAENNEDDFMTITREEAEQLGVC